MSTSGAAFEFANRALANAVFPLGFQASWTGLSGTAGPAEIVITKPWFVPALNPVLRAAGITGPLDSLNFQSAPPMFPQRFGLRFGFVIAIATEPD